MSDESCTGALNVMVRGVLVGTSVAKCGGLTVRTLSGAFTVIVTVAGGLLVNPSLARYENVTVPEKFESEI